MAEIIGGIAIVCSLVFVGLQIRQNSRISEVNAYQELISQISTMNTVRIEDPQFANLFWRFNHGEKPATNTEQAQLEAFLYMVFRQGDLAYQQYDKELIDRDGLVSVLAPERVFLNTELGREIWSRLSPSLNPDYVAFLNDIGLLCPQYTGTGDYCDLKKAPLIPIE